MSLVILPLTNLICNVFFGSSSGDDVLVLDRVNPDASVDIKAPVIPMPYNHYYSSNDPSFGTRYVSPKGEVVAVCNVHHIASPMVIIPEFESGSSDL
jgi:hypothetical protein